MISPDVIRTNPYDLFRYYRVWFETSDCKIPLVDGKPMLLLYMGPQCQVEQEFPMPVIGKPSVFTMELPRMNNHDLRKLAETHYLFGIFFPRSIMNAPEELFVRQHTKNLNESLKAFENVQRWTYNSVLGLDNMTPPLLPPSIPLTSTDRLKAYALILEDGRNMHLQAKVGNNQHWRM